MFPGKLTIVASMHIYQRTLRTPSTFLHLHKKINLHHNYYTFNAFIFSLLVLVSYSFLFTDFFKISALSHLSVKILVLLLSTNDVFGR